MVEAHVHRIVLVLPPEPVDADDYLLGFDAEGRCEVCEARFVLRYNTRDDGIHACREE